MATTGYIDVYRGVSPNAEIPLDGATLIKELPMTDIIQAKFHSPSFLDLAIGDYITWDSVQYNINSEVDVKKNGLNSYDYIITFESYIYATVNVTMKLNDVLEFDYTGTLSQWVDIIVSSINGNGDYGTWSKGSISVSETGYRTIHIKDQSCLSVLQKLQAEFNAEFYFSALTINFIDEINNVVMDGGSPLEIEYGQNNGLFNLTRKIDQSVPVVTRVYGFGSTRNLGNEYRTSPTDISKRLKFENAGVNYLDNNTGIYGIIEQVVEFTDIYPHRLGETTEVEVGGDIHVFKDSAMDFDVNVELLPLIVAEIHFNTGSLAGYSFQLEEYNDTEKQFTIIPFTDVNDYVLPNASLKPAVDDKFVILNISMPSSYITSAETELESATQDYLDVVSIPRVGYDGDPDFTVMKSKNIKFNAGDSVIVNDSEFGLSAAIRVTKATRLLVNEYKQTIVLANTVEVVPLQRIIQQQIAGQSNSEVVNISINHADLVKIIGNQIGSATIEAENIVAATITSNEIAAATIIAANIANATITGAKIANATITSTNIANATITGSNIASATIQGSNIAAATIQGSNIALATITASNIQSLTITATQIANATITGAKIANATVTGGNIASGTITGGNIANLTIFAGLIQNLTITAAQIANLTITGGPAGKIAGSTITEINIVANTITAASIQALTITANELAANSVTASKIIANAVTADKINVATLSAISANIGAITAGTINGVTITGGTIQTASSGQRIVMAGVDNTLKFYDSVGALIITIDDNIYTTQAGMKIGDSVYLDGAVRHGGVGSVRAEYNTGNILLVDGTKEITISANIFSGQPTIEVTSANALVLNVPSGQNIILDCDEVQTSAIDVFAITGNPTIDSATITSGLTVSSGGITLTGAQTILNTSGDLTINPASELDLNGNLNFTSSNTIKTSSGNLNISPSGSFVVVNAGIAATDWISTTDYLRLGEITTPGATANWGKVYTKSDNKLYFQDGAGVEHEIAFV